MDFYSKAIQLIKENKIDKTLKLIESFFHENDLIKSEHYNIFIALNAQFVALNQHKSLNTISFEQENIIISNIRYSIIELIDKLSKEQENKKNKSVKKEIRIIINTPPEEYTLSEQISLINKIKELLILNYDLSVRSIIEKNIEIIIELTDEDIRKFKKLIKQQKFEEFSIMTLVIDSEEYTDESEKDLLILKLESQLNHIKNSLKISELKNELLIQESNHLKGLIEMYIAQIKPL